MPDMNQEPVRPIVPYIQPAPPRPPAPAMVVVKRTPQEVCAEIREKLSAVATNMAVACALVVEVVDSDGWTPEDIAELVKCDTYIIRNMERCGRQHLLPELVIGTTPGRRALVKLSVAEQHKYLTAPLEVMTAAGEVLLMAVDSLTHTLCRQVFDGPRVRTLPEQRAWLETESRRQRVQVAVADYTVQGGCLVVPPHEGTLRLTLEQVLRAATEMQRRS